MRRKWKRCGTARDTLLEEDDESGESSRQANGATFYGDKRERGLRLSAQAHGPGGGERAGVPAGRRIFGAMQPRGPRRAGQPLLLTRAPWRPHNTKHRPKVPVGRVGKPARLVRDMVSTGPTLLDLLGLRLGSASAMPIAACFERRVDSKCYMILFGFLLVCADLPGALLAAAIAPPACSRAVARTTVEFPSSPPTLLVEARAPVGRDPASPDWRQPRAGPPSDTLDLNRNRFACRISPGDHRPSCSAAPPPRFSRSPPGLLTHLREWPPWIPTSNPGSGSAWPS